ncbi:hypothetical protein RSAG8_08510, partial [Rhizoctonia solani AG-8 WAC10335]
MATGWLDMNTIMEGLMDAPLGGQSSKVPDSSEQIQAERIRAAIERISARRQALKESGSSLVDERGAQETPENTKQSDDAPGSCPTRASPGNILATPPMKQLATRETDT